MSYKVFFVEDEIVTREGIRDNVDWQADGFELCGDAPDGEMALPLLQAAKPDVLITDIKMPFMDGLQLSKIVRERMPQTKIVILSGHDEFEYAQEAIKLGITEYLLKPVTVQDIRHVLQRVASTMDREGKELAELQKLKNQVQENRAALTERLLLKLLVGAISPTEAIEQSELLGLDLIARCYLVVVIRIAACDPDGQFDYSAYQRVQEAVACLAAKNPDVFLLRKDLEELALIIKGETPECLQEDKDASARTNRTPRACLSMHLAASARAPRALASPTSVNLLSKPWRKSNARPAESAAISAAVDTAELLKVDRSAVQDYLKCGVKAEFDDFFNAFIFPFGEAAFQSAIIKNYVLLDLVFTTARFVKELGGEIETVLPGLDQIETVLANLKTIEQIREQAHQILTAALAFRDNQTGSLHAGVILQAKGYIEQCYTDPDLSLQAVASHVGHSPCHFSTVFGEETGHTFKEYLTETRIKRAKELLRTTTLRSSEIADQVGFNDPHYFSLVFRKHTGLSPKEFRLQAQPEKAHS